MLYFMVFVVMCMVLLFSLGMVFLLLVLICVLVVGLVVK